jgi:hypothetical protein
LFFNNFKNVDDDKINHAVAMDEEINKFVWLILSSFFFSHLPITPILQNTLSVSFRAQFFQETNTFFFNSFFEQTFLFVLSPILLLTYYCYCYFTAVMIDEGKNDSHILLT